MSRKIKRMRMCLTCFTSASTDNNQLKRNLHVTLTTSCLILNMDHPLFCCEMSQF